MADNDSAKLPLSEMVKAVPGMLGIRLEEEPPFELLKEEASISFRRYEPMLIATVRMQGPREKVVDEAFSKLSSYIFGANSAGTKYGMTTPVFQICESAAAFPESLDQEWTVGFVMAKDLRFEDLPHPEDESIRFAQWPIRTLAAYRYSGNNDDAHVLNAVEELKKGLAESGYEPKSRLLVAQYDQPFAIPLFKRNEVLVEVEMPDQAEHSYA